jgi:hypothetical protein
VPSCQSKCPAVIWKTPGSNLWLPSTAMPPNMSPTRCALLRSGRRTPDKAAVVLRAASPQPGLLAGKARKHSRMRKRGRGERCGRHRSRRSPRRELQLGHDVRRHGPRSQCADIASTGSRTLAPRPVNTWSATDKHKSWLQKIAVIQDKQQMLRLELSPFLHK